MNSVQDKNERGSKKSGSPSARTEQRHRELREALLAAAERRIAAAGIRELKARELAQDAGCALGALYTVFADLDSLILEVNARTLDALEAAIRAADEDGDPVDRMAALAEAYFAYAFAHRPRWGALFQHRMAEGRPTPGWYVAHQARLFALVEAPLAAICPDVQGRARTALARSLFSAVQGVVALGLDEKLGPMPEAQLREHVRLLSRALARGLAG